MAWTPLDIPNIQLLLTPAFGKHMWQEAGASATAADAAGDRVGTIDEPVNGFRIEADTSGTRPLLGNDSTHGAYLDFDGTVGNRRLYVRNTQKLLRFTNQDRLFWVFFRYQRNVADDAGGCVFDQIQLSGANVGIGCQLNASEQVQCFLANDTTTILNMSSAAAADTNAHEVLWVCNPTASASQLILDANAPVTASVGSAGGTDGTADLQFGLRTSSVSPLNARLYLFAMGTGTLSAEDLVLLRAYKPQLAPTGSIARHTGTGATPTDHSHLHYWVDFTDTDYLYQEDATTPVTSEDDPVGLVVNKKAPPTGCDYNRNWAQTDVAKCPLWKLNQVNSLGAPLWAGESADVVAANFTGENNLIFSGTAGSWTPRGAVTRIITYRNLRAASGSHVFRATSGGYGVQTGSGYQSGARGDFVWHHDGATAYSSEFNEHPEEVSILVMQTAGTYIRCSMNGVWAPAKNDYVALVWNLMGRPYNAPDLGNPWDMSGNVVEDEVYCKLLTQAELNTRLTALQTKYAVQGVRYVSSGYMALQHRRRG